MSHSIAIKCTCCGAGLPASRVNDIVECEYCGIKSRITETGKSQKLSDHIGHGGKEYYEQLMALKAARQTKRQQKMDWKQGIAVGTGSIAAIAIAAHLIRKSRKK